MKYKHLFWGLLLIAIGLLFILNNLGVIHFSWFSFWRLWPVILLFWGIAILPVKDFIKYILLGVVLISTFIVINRLPEGKPWFWHFRHPENSFRWEWDDEDKDTTISTFSEQNLSVPFDSLAKRGILNLDAAAGNFIIKDSSAEFLSFSKKGDISNYELTTKDVNGDKKIELKMKEGSSTVHHIDKNQVEMKLSTKPVWNLKMSIGAASANLDLSRYKVDTAMFEAGATSITVKLGERNPKTVVDFNAGVTSIEVEVPKNAGCQVTSESFLASKSLEGFDNKGNHVYQTPNFNSSKVKIYLNVKTAISSVEVKRY
jgi:hypothetical protein